jgi:outer membrane protein assembly factor BamB
MGRGTKDGEDSGAIGRTPSATISRSGSAEAAPAAHEDGGQSNLTNGDALPAGWTEHFDEKNGLPYYYAASTGSTVWQRPTEPALPAAAPVVAPPTKVDVVSDLVDIDLVGVAATSPATNGHALPAGWTEHFDGKSGLAYYYAASTGSTVWQRPTEPASLAAPPVVAPPTKVDVVSDLDVAATTPAPAPAAPSAPVTTAAEIKVLFPLPSLPPEDLCVCVSQGFSTFHSASM